MVWRQLRKEVPWLLGILVTGFISFVGLFGLQGLNEKSLDIALHDTFFVFRPNDIFLGLVMGFGLLIYLVRCLLGSLNNVSANLILIIFAGFNIIVITLMISAYDAFISKWVVYPPQSYHSQIPEPMSAGVLQGIRYLLVALIIVVSIITTVKLRKRIA